MHLQMNVEAHMVALRAPNHTRAVFYMRCDLCPPLQGTAHLATYNQEITQMLWAHAQTLFEADEAGNA